LSKLCIKQLAKPIAFFLECSSHPVCVERWTLGQTLQSWSGRIPCCKSSKYTCCFFLFFFLLFQ